MGGPSGRSRQAGISLANELDDLKRDGEKPRVYVVETYVVPCEPAPHPRWVCPLTGETKVKALETRLDLQTAIILDDGSRRNRWEADDPEEWDELFGDVPLWSEAAESDEYIPAWRFPLHLKVPARDDLVDALVSDGYETIYWSGGWRSSKTYCAGTKWQREWVKRGGQGRLFWLIGPQILNAYRMFQKLFHGKQGTPPLFPAHGRDAYDKPVSLFARTPAPHKHELRDLSFSLPDRSVVEQYHGHGEGGHTEGESVEVVWIDEVARIKKPGIYEVATGRVMESGGVVLLSGVPDDAGEWVFDKVVAPFENNKNTEDRSRLVLYMSGFDNPWVEDAKIRRRERGEVDPKVVEEKIYGKWSRHGRFAYGDVFDEARHTRDELAHSEQAWGLGPDITRHVSRVKLKHAADYIVGCDFNGDPQTRLVCKVFGKQADWRSWVLVPVDEIVTSGDGQESAAELAGETKWASKRHGDQYRGAACVLDANAFHSFARYGGKRSRTYDAVHYRNLGFGAVPPIKNVKPGKPSTNSNPDLDDSRTVIRHLFREDQVVINAGKCPGLVFAINNAPRRKKLNRDKSTWMDRKVYNLEDALRYVTWRVFASFVFTRRKKLDDEMRGKDTA